MNGFPIKDFGNDRKGRRQKAKGRRENCEKRHKGTEAQRHKGTKAQREKKPCGFPERRTVFLH